MSKNRKYWMHIAMVAFSSAVKSNFFNLSADFHHFEKEKIQEKRTEKEDEKISRNKARKIIGREGEKKKQ